MKNKKHIVIIGVLCVISLGLGYVYGKWRQGSGQENAGNAEDKEETATKELEFLKQGLVAYYPFNGNAKDATTNNYHGFLEGPTSTTNRFGQPNQAITFDGADDRVSLPNQVFHGLEALTFSTWLNLDSADRKSVV